MNWGALLGIAGAGLGGGSRAAALNRQGDFYGGLDLATLLNQREMGRQNLLAGADNDYTSNQIARSQEGRASGQDAWRKLLSAEHTLDPGARPQLAGPYNIAPRQANPIERQGADALANEVMQRLQGGNPIAEVTKRPVDLAYDPMSTVDPRLLKAGKGEKWSGWLGAILSGLSGLGGGSNPGKDTGRDSATQTPSPQPPNTPPPPGTTAPPPAGTSSLPWQLLVDPNRLGGPRLRTQGDPRFRY